MELILFVLSSILIGRVLEKTKYRVAVICHAIVFYILLVTYFFGSDWEAITKIGNALFGESTYGTLHAAFSGSVVKVARIGYSALAIAEIVTLMSLIFIAIRGVIKAKAKLLRLIKINKYERVISVPVIRMDKGPIFNASYYSGKDTCLRLSRLRN